MNAEDEEFQRIEREAALRAGVVQGNRTMIEMARKAFETPGTEPAFRNGFWTVTQEELERFAELVRADERKRVTNLLLYMHNKAAPYHNYYKHAAVELNRKAGEGEKI